MSRKSWRLVRIKEDLSLWDEEVRSRAKEVWSIYLYNPNVVTHCCSFARDYWLVFLDYDVIPNEATWNNEKEREELYDWIDETKYEACQYGSGYYSESLTLSLPFVSTGIRDHFDEVEHEEVTERALEEWIHNGLPDWRKARRPRKEGIYRG